MRNIFSFILDFLFPPTTEVLRLRSISPDKISSILEPSSSTPLPFITSIFSYKDPLVTELVLSIKNRKDSHSIECASRVLYDFLRQNPEKKIALVPIPISKKRFRERGFNQCEILVDGICRLDIEKRFEKKTDILFRTKDGGEHNLRGRSERLGIHGVFSSEPHRTNLPIILIDDVVTTGATLCDAKEALSKAGYENVAALTLAH